MASDEVTVRKWTCDGCKTSHLSDNNSRELPSGWTTEKITEEYTPDAPSEKTLEFCTDCSKDPTAAIQNYKDSILRY